MAGTRYVLAMILMAAAPASATGAVVKIGASQDNTLYSDTDPDQCPVLSNGAGQNFFVGRTGPGGLGSSRRRALVQFDIAGTIPAGSTITAASLTLNLSRVSMTSAAASVSVHLVESAWGEGASDAEDPEGFGALAETGDATWCYTHYPTTDWTNSGGDFVAGASATQSVNAVGPYVFGSTVQMVADVQTWLDDPSSNHGWMLLGDEITAGNAKRFDSRQNSTPSVRPSLTIEYSAEFEGYLTTVTPCRVVDTRNPDGPLGGPTLDGGSARIFTLTGACGIPISAQALTLNVTAVSPTGAGRLTLYPGDLPTATDTNVVAFNTGTTRAALLVVKLAANGTLAVFPTLSGEVDLLIDVTGYFQ